MDSKGNQLVKKRLLKFWVVLGLYGLPTGSATAIVGFDIIYNISGIWLHPVYMARCFSGTQHENVVSSVQCILEIYLL